MAAVAESRTPTAGRPSKQRFVGVIAYDARDDPTES